PEAERCLRETITLAERTQNFISLTYGWLNLGNALSLAGRFEEAEAALKTAIEVSERAEHPEGPDWSRIYLAHLYLMRDAKGDAMRALELADQVLATPHSGDEQIDASAYLWRARALLSLGDPARALSAIEAALQVRQDLGSLEEDEEEMLFTHYLIL